MSFLMHSSGQLISQRFGRVGRMLACLALLLNVAFPLAAAARQPIEATKPAAIQPTNPLTGVDQSPTITVPQAPQAVNIVATKDDRLSNDVDGNGRVNAGDGIRYTIGITNSGSTDATSLTFNDTIDGFTTLVGGSVDVSPLASNDVFSTVGNTQLLVGITQPANTPAVAVAGSLFSNDSEFLGDTFSLQSFQATSAQNGTVAVNANGTFSYTPAAGFTGNDTFTYTIVDSRGLKSAATVTITVANRVWYVDNSVANGDGRSISPFNSLANAQTVGAVNDIIFVNTGSGNYGAITLKNGQQLIGRGVNLVVGGFTLLTAGTRPTLSAAGTLVTLAQNNTIQGLNINSQAAGLGISGTNFGTANISSVGMNGGPALTLITGTLNATFDQLISTGGATGVSLTTVAGSLNVTAGSMSNISGTDFLISGGTVSVTYPGSITNTTGRSIDINGHATGAITLSGAINDTGTGIVIQNNTSGTITFSNSSKVFNTGANTAITLTSNTGTTIDFSGGGLNITTSTGTGMDVTGGGTLKISGNSNIINTTNGKAFNMVNTTSGGITFEKISANANNGIGVTLNTIGTGGFTITGIGGNDGSGGTIQNASRGIEITSASNISLNNITLTNANTVDTTGTCTSSANTNCNAAIYLNTVTTISLTNLSITNVQQYAINGRDVTNMTLADSGILNCGNEASEGCLRFVDLLGTSSITDSAIALNPFSGYNGERAAWIVNTRSILNLSVRNSTFSDTASSTNGGNGFELSLQQNATATVTINGSLFLRNGTIGLQVLTSDASNATVTATSSLFDFDTAPFGRGVEFAASQASSLKFLVGSSTINSKGGVALAVATNDSASANGFITTNTITGTVGGVGSGVLIRSRLASTIKVEISGNLINKLGSDNGILIDHATADSTHTSRIDAFIDGNTITTDTNAAYGINLTALPNQTICALLIGNKVTELASGGGLGQLGALRGRASAAGATLYLQGFNTSVATTWINFGNTPANAARVSQSGSGTIAAPPGGTCTQPTPFAAVAGAPTPASTSDQPAVEQVEQSEPQPESIQPAGDSAVVAPASQTIAAATAAQTRTAALDMETPTAGETVNVPIGTLPAGTSITIIFDVTVGAPVPAAKEFISNQASVSGSNFITTLSDDPATVAASDPTLTPLDAAPNLVISKSDGGSTSAPGSTIAYTLNYTNTGTQVTAGVVLTETVPLNTSFNAVASTAGWSCTPNSNAGAVCTLAIGVLATDASSSATFAVTVVNPVPAGVTQVSNTATIGDNGASGADLNPANNTASDTTPITAQPDLEITKSDGGIRVMPGDIITYTLNYTNTGNQAATNIVLTETVPLHTAFNAAASSAGWTCAPNGNAGSICTLPVGALAGGGASGSRVFAVTVNNQLPLGVTQTTNTVTIADDGTNGADPTPANNTASDITPLIAVPDLVLSKTDGGLSATPGSTIIYTLRYTNTGAVAASGIVLTETVPVHTTFNAGASTAGWVCTPNGTAGSTCTLAVGTVAGGGANDSAIFAVTVVNPAPAGVTQISNTASIADDGANGADANLIDNTASDTTPLTAAPDLTLTKSDGGATAVPGGTIAYTLSYTNTGNQTATGIVLTETVPANTTFNAAGSSAGWVCAPNSNAGSTCTIPIGALAGGGANGSRVFAVTVANPAPAGVTQISNTASIADDGANGADANLANNTANDTTPLTAAPDLTVIKSDGGATAAPSGTVAYTLTYSNVGNQNATGVVLTETVPANTTFNTAASSAGWVCTPNTNAGSTCTIPIGALAGGGANGSRVFAVTVVNPAPAGVTQISNTASIADDGANGGDPTPANNTASDTTPINAAPDLALTKSDGGATAVPGDTVVYTLSYSNVGNQGALGIVLTETVPANTTFNAGASSAGWVCAPNANAGSTCTLNIAPLAGGGANGTATFAVTLVNPVPAGVNQISNTASIADDGANGGDPTPANNIASDTTAVTAAPDLRLGKTDGGIASVPGGTIAYTLIYTNTGNQGATGIVLTETVPANTTFNAGASTSGWVCAPNSSAGSTCTLAVGMLGGGNLGSVTFAVTVLNPVPAGVTQISNTASIADDGANGGDATPANNTASDTTPVNAAPDLALTKSDGNATVAPGGTVAYTLSYTNTGNQNATGIVLTETVPANTTFNAGASTLGWVCAPNTNAGSTCTLAVGALAGGNTNDTATFAVTVVNPVPAGVTQINNSASIADDGANGSDPTPANNTASDTTPIGFILDLSITKSVNPTVAQVGDVVTYTIRFASSGNVIANGVRITDTLPSQLTFIGSTSSGASVTQIGAAPNLVWTVDNLNPGASGIITVTATVNPTTTEETVVNTVTIDHPQETEPANNTATATFTINLPPVANAGGPYSVNEGSSVVLSAAGSTDPGNDTLTFEWDLDNDGIYETIGITVTFSNTADDAVHTVGLRVTDSENSSTTTTTTVTVLNVAPSVDAGSDRNARPNEVINFSGSFTDPGVLDTHTIVWDFGDGTSTTGTLTPSHAYTNPGTYTVTLTITDDDNGVGTDSLRVVVGFNKIYLPLIMKSAAPTYADLVVQSITPSATGITVVIKNQGDKAVTESFWVDLYLNPNPAPTQVNQIWEEIAPYGMVWGVTNVNIQPNQTLTLVTRGTYFRQDLSSYPASIPAGTKVYVQVDSANANTTYGAVLETHEANGGAYNNVSGPVTTTQPIVIPTALNREESQNVLLPQRPQR